MIAKHPTRSSGAAPRRARTRRWLLITPPLVWLTAFFLAPFLIVAKIALSTPEIAQPPYVPAFAPLSDPLTETWNKIGQLGLDSFGRLLSERVYIDSLLSSFVIAAGATTITLLIGYSLAYAMARAPRFARPALLLFVALPFFTSFLIRVYAWMALLSPDGVLNNVLIGAGLIHSPLVILSTNRAVFIGLVYSYLPFMVLPIYAALEKLDGSLVEAAQDLGASPLDVFWRIVVPLSRPGVIAGCMLVFIPAVGEFVVPDLLGGSDTLMIGKTLWEEFNNNHDWPTAAAVAVALLALIVVPLAVFQNNQLRLSEAEP